MQRTTPPFRADHVGSLLRPAALKEARAKHAEKQITDAQLAEVEDREIEKIVRKQEEVGLKLATDGEFRRSWWHFDFYKGLDGVEMFDTGKGIVFAGVETKAEAIRIVGKVGFSGHRASRAFQVPEGAQQGHAEDDHPGAEHDALPAGPAEHQQAGLSGHGRLLRRSRHGLPEGDPRVL